MEDSARGQKTADAEWRNKDETLMLQTASATTELNMSEKCCSIRLDSVGA